MTLDLRIQSTTESVRAAAERAWDAIVVGAGPAGSAAAWALATRGARVLLIDRDTHPRPKVCGCCMGPLGLAALETIGVLDELPALHLARVEIHARERTTTLPLPRTRAIPRDTMDAALIHAAYAAGSEVLIGRRAVLESTVQEASGVVAEHGGVRVPTVSGEVMLRTRAIIDARGLRAHGGHGTHARPRLGYVGLGAVVDRDAVGGGVLPDGLRMIVEPLGYLGLAPLPTEYSSSNPQRTTHSGATLAAAVRTEALRSDTGPGRDAVLRGLLRRAGVDDDQRVLDAFVGVPPLRARRDVQDGPVLRVGDAARFVEPITGEGMGWALAAGLAVAEHALAPQRYTWARAHGRLLRRSYARCAMISALTHRPRVLAYVLGGLGIAPRVRDAVVAGAAGRSRVRMSA